MKTVLVIPFRVDYFSAKPLNGVPLYRLTLERMLARPDLFAEVILAAADEEETHVFVETRIKPEFPGLRVVYGDPGDMTARIHRAAADSAAEVVARGSLAQPLWHEELTAEMLGDFRRRRQSVDFLFQDKLPAGFSFDFIKKEHLGLLVGRYRHYPTYLRIDAEPRRIRVGEYLPPLHPYLWHYPANLVVSSHLELLVIGRLLHQPPRTWAGWSRRLAAATRLLLDRTVSAGQLQRYVKRDVNGGIATQPEAEVLRRKKEPRLLLISEPTIGDTLTIARLARHLMRRLPRLRVELLVDPGVYPLARHFRGLSAVTPFSWEALAEGKRSADLTVNLMDIDMTRRGEAKPERYASRFHPAGVPWGLDDVYAVPAEQRRWARTWLAGLARDARRPLIAFAPFAANEQRSWTVDSARRFTALLVERGFQPIVLHTARLFDVPGALYPPPPPLEALPAVLAEARALVAVDTGAVHLALAVHTPVFVLGFAVPGYATPYRREKYLVAGEGVDCPCFYQSGGSCRRCREALTPEYVLAEFQEWLDGVQGGDRHE